MSEFRAIPRELLERHIAESTQPNRATAEAAVVPDKEPDRPENVRRAGYAQGDGNFVSETMAAEHNNKLVNREYLEHQRSAQKDLQQHMEKTAAGSGDRGAAREALQQHFKDTAREVTGRGGPDDPNSRSRERVAAPDPDNDPSKTPTAARLRVPDRDI